MSISETAREALKTDIAATVKEAIENKIYPPEPDEVLDEGYKKKAKKEADDVDAEDEEVEVEESDDDDDDDSKEDDEDEDPVEESMTVTAMLANSGKKKPQTLSARNHRDLVRLAKSGKYEYLTVKKKDGSKVEYMVDRGKLVEM